MNILEILFKIGTSTLVVIVICWQIFFLKWLWSNQIYLKATFSRIIKLSAPETDVIAIREQNKIYQNGNVVGIILGKIEIDGDDLILEKLTDTKSLNKTLPFEYKYDKYMFVRQKSAIGISIHMSADGKRTTEQDVLQNVICKKVK